jgi:hypothetical protein
MAAPAAVAEATATASTAPTVAAASSSTGPAHHTQRRNIAPTPNYFELCARRGQNDPVCMAEVLAAIKNARKHDHHMTKRAMILPNNYTQLTVAEQTFVVMNLERVDRGIRPIEGLVPKLNLVSHLAAVLRVDPIVSNLVARLLGIGEWRSIWAGDLGPLASDYDWMYRDGYSSSGSINVACPRPTAAGCWGHRHNILSRFAGLAHVIGGAGTAKPLGASIAALTAGIRGKAPHFTYTWRQALNHGANGHKIVASAAA